MEGESLAPMQFDSMADARDFMQQYEDVVGFKFWGNTNYIHQFITTKFPGEIKFNRSMVNAVNLDIEVQFIWELVANALITAREPLP